jgi:hypothetical protein
MLESVGSRDLRGEDTYKGGEENRCVIFLYKRGVAERCSHNYKTQKSSDEGIKSNKDISNRFRRFFSPT